MSIIERIQKLLLQYLGESSFVFRSMYYDRDTTISDTDVKQYEFINQGSSVVDINGMFLQPKAANEEPVRWSGAIQNNENDATIYKVKFSKPTIKYCSGAFCMAFVPCEPPATCIYTFSITLDGIQIVAFLIDCTMSSADIQLLINANILPAYSGTVTVNFDDIGGLCIAITNMVVAVGGAGLVIGALELRFGECGDISPQTITLVCEVIPQTNKLLVISKVSARVQSQDYGTR